MLPKPVHGAHTTASVRPARAIDDKILARSTVAEIILKRFVPLFERRESPGEEDDLS